LMRTQADRTARSMTLEQTLDTVGFVLSEPLGNFGSWGLENVGEFAAGALCPFIYARLYSLAPGTCNRR
jgi:hypothetical protein